MQTNNRLIYCKGGAPIKKGQAGTMIPQVQGIGLEGMDPLSNFDPAASIASGMANIKPKVMPKLPGVGGGGIGGGLLSGAAGIAADLVGGLFGPKNDPIAGGIEKGLDPNEMSEIENTGKGKGVASGILGTVGDLAGNIPGPWGAVAKFGLKTIGSALGGAQAKEQAAKVKGLVAANTERKTDLGKMEGLASMGQNGGILYKKPNRILSLVTGGVYKEGGKAPTLAWDHPFTIELQEGTLEKKKRPVKVFKRGGKFNNPDKTNVIVAGARHHESNSLGDKGVPVIDDAGEKVFEVETGELILTKDATTKVEAFLSKYKKVEIDEDKAHSVLKALGTYFKEEIKDNLHNYEEKNVV